ncbi:MAG: ComEC/Rec2 family competence protein, partial [Planctomycetaceae bacterium]|nr:ComEC/Rec2 family competence protein [Planctomycetaceae bacterium]
MSTEPRRRPRPPSPPLVPLALAAIAGVAADRYGDPWDTASWGRIVVGAVAVILAGAHRRGWAWDLALLVAFAGLGGGWHHHRWSDLQPDDLAWSVSETPRPAWVRGVVRDVLGIRPDDGPQGHATTRAVLDLTGFCDGKEWHRASGRAQLIVVGDRGDLEAGQPVEAAGALASLAGPLNPGEFDHRAYLRAQGIRLRLTVDDPEGVWRDPDGADRLLLRGLGRLRAWSHARLVEGLDPAVAPLASALLLGRREEVDPDVNDAFARTGTTHLLAISGLHFQVLAVTLLVAFRMLGLGRRTSFAAVGAMTVAYALLVGLAPSVVRSAVMTVTVCVAECRARPTRPANLLALAALATLALNPAHLFDIGCQLSFLAVAAIVWGVAPATHRLGWAYAALMLRVRGPGGALDDLERKLEPWWKARMRRFSAMIVPGVIVSLVVWLVTLPLVTLRFHLVPPIGLLLNIPLIQLTSLALLAAGLTLALSAIWGPLGVPSAWVCAKCLIWTESLVLWGASRPWGHWFVPGPPWGWVLACYGLLGLATVAGYNRWPGRRRAWWTPLGVWLALGLGMNVLSTRPETLEADILAVGHGLAVVIQSPDGRAVVYDCGRMRDPNVGRRILAPALWSRGVRHIDAILLSHADADHYNGLPDLLERFSVGAVRIAPGFDRGTDPAVAQLLQAVRARRIPIRTIAAGDAWEAAGVRVSVLHPPAAGSPLDRDNDRSVVLDLESDGRHLLLTGDLEQAGLSQLVSHPGGPFDVLLAPHHGGRTANPAWLYRWANPARVVVSQRPPAPGTHDALAPLEA